MLLAFVPDFYRRQVEFSHIFSSTDEIGNLSGPAHKTLRTSSSSPTWLNGRDLSIAIIVFAQCRVCIGRASQGWLSGAHTNSMSGMAYGTSRQGPHRTCSDWLRENHRLPPASHCPHQCTALPRYLLQIISESQWSSPFPDLELQILSVDTPSVYCAPNKYYYCY